MPTEAEWEYAAKSGGLERRFPWGNVQATCDYAILGPGSASGCGEGRPHVPCSRTAGNTLQGICDMAGNLAEWVEDDYHTNYDGAPNDGSAWVDTQVVFENSAWGRVFLYQRYVDDHLSITSARDYTAPLAVFSGTRSLI